MQLSLWYKFQNFVFSSQTFSNVLSLSPWHQASDSGQKLRMLHNNLWYWPAIRSFLPDIQGSEDMHLPRYNTAGCRRLINEKGNQKHTHCRERCDQNTFPFFLLSVTVHIVLSNRVHNANQWKHYTQQSDRDCDHQYSWEQWLNRTYQFFCTIITVRSKKLGKSS